MAEREIEVLEEGDIFFLYRPDVNEHEPAPATCSASSWRCARGAAGGPG